jgi:enterobacterial common antigen flippase
MIKAIFTIGAIQFVQMAVLLVRTKGLALLLGPEQVGVLAVIDKLLAVFAQTASLSLPFAALRFLPSLWTAAPAAFYARLRGMSAVTLGLSVVATAIGLALTLTDAGRWGAQLRPYAPVVLLALLTIPAQMLLPFVTNATAATMSPNRSMVVALGHAVVFAASGLAGAWWFGLPGIYALYALPATLLLGTLAMRLNRPPIGLEVPSLAASAAALPGEVWRFGLAMVGLTFLAPYAALFVHYRVLADIGPEAAGWMQAAIGISLAVRTVLGSAHPVFLTPNVNRGGAPEDRMHWANEYQKTLCILIGIVLPPLLLFPGVAIQLLYSAEFGPGADYVFLFVLVEIVTLFAGTYQSLVLALDRLWYHVTQNLIAQGLMIVVGMAAIRPLGIAGAALAALSAHAFLYVSTSLFLHRSFGIRVSTRSALLSVYVVAMIVVAGLIGRLPGTFELPVLALRAAVYALLVLPLAAFLTRDDRLRIRDMARKFARA